jgi:hypothetical protein
VPFKSRAQARWMFAKKPALAKEWAEKTDWEELPETAQDAKTVANVKKKLADIKKRKARFPETKVPEKKVRVVGA